MSTLLLTILIVASIWATMAVVGWAVIHGSSLIERKARNERQDPTK